jgi:putative nucleotidyltransferase with HDIG domain
MIRMARRPFGSLVLAQGRPPRLLVKAVIVTFVTVTALLSVVFFFVRMTIRDQVRQTVADNLDASQRTVAALERRRQLELRMQAVTLAESPTLKAALDTYAAEGSGGDDSAHGQLLATIRRELDKLAARFEADAIILVDGRGVSLAAVGPFAGRWPDGRPVQPAAAHSRPDEEFDGVIHAGGEVFRAMRVPLVLNEGVTIGSLYVATALDRRFVEQLDRMSRARTAIISDGSVIASTLAPSAARDLETALRHGNPDEGVIELDGGSQAYLRLATAGPASVYAISSIDEAASGAMRRANQSLVAIGVGAIALGLLGSAWLAKILAEPIGRLSTSLAAIAASHDVSAKLPLDGSSRELDALADTFNALMASVAEAEAQTEAAYAGAIRALAAALDARDPYTAGHSDRVSVLSVAIGRVLELSHDDIEVLRLGALLHDIGKIGVADEILRKPAPLTPREYDAIKQHPEFGARILRSIPFLARHIAIVELHHERPDGGGYPHGLRGGDIPLLARVVHVADAYDAITSARAYRAPRSTEDALRELWRCSGTEYDAEIVGALVAALPGVTSSAEPVQHLEALSA